MTAKILHFPGKRLAHDRLNYVGRGPTSFDPPPPPTLEERFVRAARRMDRPRIIEAMLMSYVRVSLASRDVIINPDAMGTAEAWAKAIRTEVEKLVETLERL